MGISHPKLFSLTMSLPMVAAVIVGVFLIAPIIIVVPMSFSTALSFEFPPPGYWLGYYERFFSSRTWLLPTANSFVIAFATMLITLGITVPAAIGYVRYRFRGRSLVNLVIMAPLIVPNVVAAVGYYGYLSKLGIVGTRPGVVLAHVALAVPVTFLVLCAALKGFDRNLERAAMISGAGPFRTFFHVTLPVLKPGILTATLFAFLASFNDAVVAIFIGGRDGSTLPKKMFESIRLESDPVIAVVSTLLTAGVLAGIISSFLLRRKP